MLSQHNLERYDGKSIYIYIYNIYIYHIYILYIYISYMYIAHANKIRESTTPPLKECYVPCDFLWTEVIGLTWTIIWARSWYPLPNVLGALLSASHEKNLLGDFFSIT